MCLHFARQQAAATHGLASAGVVSDFLFVGVFLLSGFMFLKRTECAFRYEVSVKKKKEAKDAHHIGVLSSSLTPSCGQKVVFTLMTV